MLLEWYECKTLFGQTWVAPGCRSYVFVSVTRNIYDFQLDKCLSYASFSTTYTRSFIGMNLIRNFRIIMEIVSTLRNKLANARMISIKDLYVLSLHFFITNVNTYI